MPRQPRIEIPGGFYHVISRGIERRKIYRDKSDYLEFLSRLEESLKSTNTQCYAWVLMNNHFHLLLRPLSLPLSSLMRKLMTGYSIYFNARHRRVGHLFQNRYKSILCQEDSYFLELIRYIHLNPVRAGFIKTPGELARYPWSGHSAIVGQRKNEWQETEEVLLQFERRKKEAIDRYKQFIRDGWNMGMRKDLVGGGLIRSAGGRSGYYKLKASGERWQSDARILGDGDFVKSSLEEVEDKIDTDILLKRKYDLRELLGAVCNELDVDKDLILTGRRLRTLTKAKAIYAFIGNEYLRESLKSIGDTLKISSQSVLELKEKGRGMSEMRDVINNLIT